MRKNFKKLTAIALTAAMTMGSAMMTFAADNSSSIGGSGDYEGSEPENPALKVTLPTTADINYIADPNDLIKNNTDASGSILNAEHVGKEFSGDAGIYFLNTKSGDAGQTKNLYMNESQKLWAINKSRQDVTVSVQLKTTTSGDASIAFSDSNTFASSDAERKIYLAVKDGKSGDAAITAAGESGAATFTTDLAGNESNYEMKCDASGDYSYAMIDAKSGDAISGDAPINGWAGAAYQLEGAANKNADWGKDKLQFPAIQVTWSYGEKVTNAAPSIASSVTYSKGTHAALVIPHSLGAGELGATSVSDITLEVASGEFHSKNGVWGHPTDYAQYYTITNNSISISYDLMQYVTSADHTLYVIYDGDESTATPVTITVTD